MRKQTNKNYLLIGATIDIYINGEYLVSVSNNANNLQELQKMGEWEVKYEI